MLTKMTEGKKTIMALKPEVVAERIHEGVANKEELICDPYPIYAFTTLLRSVPTPVFTTVMKLINGISKKEKRDSIVC